MSGAELHLDMSRDIDVGASADRRGSAIDDSISFSERNGRDNSFKEGGYRGQDNPSSTEREYWDDSKDTRGFRNSRNRRNSRDSRGHEGEYDNRRMSRGNEFHDRRRDNRGTFDERRNHPMGPYGDRRRGYPEREENPSRRANSAPKATLYVTGFVRGTAARRLAEVFEPFGPLAEVNVLPPRRSDGEQYAFVAFRRINHMEHILSEIEAGNLKLDDGLAINPEIGISCEKARRLPVSRRNDDHRERLSRGRPPRMHSRNSRRASRDDRDDRRSIRDRSPEQQRDNHSSTNPTMDSHPPLPPPSRDEE